MPIIQNAFSLLFGFLETLIIIDVILSWLYRGDNNLVRTIHIFTQPILLPARRLQERIIPDLPIDFSPIIAFAVIRALESLVKVVF